jgi:predicted aspartyl protease
MRWSAMLCGFLAVIAPVPVEAAEKKPCKLVRYSEVPITTLSDGRFTVPVVAEGRKLDFLVDTGGAVATLKGGEAFNMGVRTMRTANYLEGTVGTKLTEYVVLKQFSLAGMQGHDLAAYIDTRMPVGADGSLAPDMLKHFDIDMDLMRGKFGLFSPDHCPGQVVYWTKTGYVALPMDLVSDGHIQVRVTIDGKKFNAILDTGARTSLISLSAAKALGITERSPDLKPNTDNDARYKSYEYPFKILDFDGVTVTKPHLLVVSDNVLPGTRIDLLLGIGILRRLHLFISYSEEKLYITPAGAN